MFPAGWSLFSVPIEPDPTDVRDQLSDDLANIQVFQYFDREFYEPESEQRVDIQAGIGYWIFLDNDASLDFEGVLTEPEQSLEIPLNEGWNLVGNPYDSVTIGGGDMIIINEGEQAGIDEAVARGWLAPEVYGYNQATGGYERHPIGSPMSPWDGYAIKAIEKCTLIIKKASD